MNRLSGFDHEPELSSSVAARLSACCPGTNTAQSREAEGGKADTERKEKSPFSIQASQLLAVNNVVGEKTTVSENQSLSDDPLYYESFAQEQNKTRRGQIQDPVNFRWAQLKTET